MLLTDFRRGGKGKRKGPKSRKGANRKNGKGDRNRRNRNKSKQRRRLRNRNKAQAQGKEYSMRIALTCILHGWLGIIVSSKSGTFNNFVGETFLKGSQLLGICWRSHRMNHWHKKKEVHFNVSIRQSGFPPKNADFNRTLGTRMWCSEVKGGFDKFISTLHLFSDSKSQASWKVS